MRSELIKHFLRDRKVREAATDIMIALLKEDILKGIPGDPEKCAFSCAVRRMFGPTSRGTLFYRSIAYIDTGDGWIERCRLSNELMVQIKKGDSPKQLRGPMNPGIYWCRVPAETQTLAYKREMGSTWRSRIGTGEPQTKSGTGGWTIRGSSEDKKRRKAG